MITVALESIRELSNQQLATLNLAVDAGWECQEYDGYEKVSHLFKKDGHILHDLLKKAFNIEVNRRVDDGEWQ